MNESKICPLLAMSTPPIKPPAECLGDRCAWYVPPLSSRGEGRCAVQMMSRCMPELVDGVKHL